MGQGGAKHSRRVGVVKTRLGVSITAKNEVYFALIFFPVNMFHENDCILIQT